LTFFIRLMVPESERWRESEQSGATSHWATRDMLGVVIGAAAAVLIIPLWASPRLNIGVRIAGSLLGLAVALSGFLYPVMRYLRRVRSSMISDPIATATVRRMVLGACLSGVALITFRRPNASRGRHKPDRTRRFAAGSVP
jgi:hypothetical protein